MGDKGQDILLMTDFDGVLVDSYHMLPRLFEWLVETTPPVKRIGVTPEKLLLVEEMMDFLGTLDRFTVYITAFGMDPVMAGLIVEKYWDYRMKKTRVIEPGGLEALEARARDMGARVLIITSQDDTVKRKEQRVTHALGEKAADKLVIYGPDAEYTNLSEAVESLVETLEPGVAAYVDDKSTNLNRLQHLEDEKRLLLFKRRFRPPFPRASAWTLPLRVGAVIVDSVAQALEITRERVGSNV